MGSDIQITKSGGCQHYMDNQPCFLCLSTENTDKCEKCGNVFTCKDHVKRHRSSSGGCYPYRVQYDCEMGRYLVATQKIKQGEVILHEDPLVLGPYTRSKPQCLNCFKVINPQSSIDCPGCDYPVCDELCASGRYHKDECELFSSVGFRANVEDVDEFNKQYSAVTVLRLLRVIEKEERLKSVIKNNSSDKCEHIVGMLANLMDHNEERQIEQPDVWQFEKEFIIDFLRKIKLGERFPEEKVRRATGIIQTNATSLELPSTGYGRGTAVFPTYAMMNHSCMCNTKTVINDDHSIQVIAQADIEAGQEITNQYMKADKPTIYRRHFLRQKWFFDCCCPRCSDPTERGSHLSSLLCHRRKCGGSVVPSRPLDNNSDWSCLSCGDITCLDKVQTVLEEAAELIASPAQENGVVEHFERVIHQLSSQLHPYNHLLIDIKQKLALLYGNVAQYSMGNMGRPAKQRKLQLCMEVMDCLGRVETSGYTPWRVKMMAELAKTKVAIARENFSRGLLSEAGLKAVLMQNKLLMAYIAYQQVAVTGRGNCGVRK